MSISRKLGRRQFIQSTSTIAVAAAMPGSIRAGQSIEKLRTAHIGVGGMGGSDLAFNCFPSPSRNRGSV